MKHTPHIDRTAFVHYSSSTDKIRFLLQYAHLAPSTHNIQPWIFEIQATSCRIYYDPKLLLPYNDPTRRDLYISLGCCIENLITAARYFGVFDNVAYHDGPGELVAEVTFKQLDQPAPDDGMLPQLQAITARINARGLFKKTPPPPAFLAALRELNQEFGPAAQVHLVTDRADIQQLAKFTADGLRRAYRSAAFRHEISSWIRPNTSKQRDGIPGYALRMNGPMSVALPWLMRHFNIGRRLGQINYVSLNSAPLICVYTSPDDQPLTQMQVGRLAERVMLAATASGMRTSIFVASVEIEDIYEDVQRLLDTKRRPEFLMCVGYINTPQGHTPRHPLSSRIRTVEVA